MVQCHLDTGSVPPEQRTLGRVPNRTEVRWTGVGFRQCLIHFWDVE